MGYGVFGISDKCFTLKYADDTVIVGLLDCEDGNEDDVVFRSEVERFVSWCEENHLNLNVKKTKEVVVDFRKKNNAHSPIVINGENVEFVSSYKYLGTVIDNKLKGDENVKRIVKKANKRLYFVRKLHHMKLNNEILSMFYKSTVESVITFGILSWYGNCPQHICNKLNKIIKCAKRLGCDVRLLQNLYQNLLITKVEKMMDSISSKQHPLVKYFKKLPSGKRLSVIYARVQRYRNTFIPAAIRAYNESI